MATNRPKIDWAYRQAEGLMSRTVFADPYDRIRKIADLLRRAEERGQKKALMGLIDGVQSALKTRLSKSQVATPCSHGLTDSMQCGECALDRR